MRNARGLIIEVAEVVILALLLVLVIRLVVQNIHVYGLSMYPTLHNNDDVVTLKLPYYFSSPNRGDIVILKDPYDPSQDFIKRVIGMPGDRLLIQDGKISINGHVLAEPYLQGTEPWSDTWPASDQPRQLGSDEFFVMGDNRNYSSDSRMFGPIKRNQIESHAWLRILPLNHFGWFGGPPPSITNQQLQPNDS
ncbi:MAG: signal peptidase I [Candidatus Dormibacteraceae bacterium]